MNLSHLSVRALAAVSLFLVLPGLSLADDDRGPKANWPQANRFNTDFLRQFVFSSSVSPGWINKTDYFWYSWKDSNGVKFYKVDPFRKKKGLLFDSAKMAAQLSEMLKKPYDTTNLPITTITFDEKRNNIIAFTVETTKFEYDLDTERLWKVGSTQNAATPANPLGNRDFKNFSPDKKAYVYAMDDNLYFVEVEKVKDKDGKETDKDKEPIQLTKDGEKDYSFGSRRATDEQLQLFQQQTGQTTTAPPSRERRVRANVVWSEDSKRFYVTRSDARKVKDLFLVNVLSEPRPTLMTYKYAMPGEENITLSELFAFDPAKKELRKLTVGKYKDQSNFNIHFPSKEESDKLRFVRRDRLQRNLELCEVDLNTDKCDVLITESVENAFLELEPVRYVKKDKGSDMIWWSERSGWGHFYLYDNHGKLKNVITSGPFRAERVVDVDEKNGVLWFEAEGREANENPYYAHLYRVKLDGKDMRLVNAGDADHSASLSPNKKFIVDNGSRTDMAPKSVLRDENGEVLMELETMDIARLAEHGWKMPETFKVKAADGVTDIYGNMWKPFDFDAKKRYPIIANVYPGPQTESVSSTFSAMATNQRLAQLGFIVIQIGNRGGNPARSNAYHSYGYYNLRDYGLADKKSGIEQLAARYAWIDLDRVGIFGHSGGGFMTAAALLLPPYNDFFKVGVSSSGNHDNNVYNWNWSEQHHGLREVPVTGTTNNSGMTGGFRGGRGGRGGGPDDEFVPTVDEGFNYDPLIMAMDPQAQGTTGAQTKFDIKIPTNHELAANLKGKLLLVHGDMDNNVHPAGTIKLVNALIKANKRFDLMIMPGQAHGYGTMTPYFTQLMMEYFAEHLLGDNYRHSADMNERK